jgi:hypothetical protein
LFPKFVSEGAEVCHELRKRGTTRTNAATVKTVAGNLGAVAARIRGQVDHFLQALRAA